MSEFKLILTNKQGKRSVVYPNSMDIEDKIYLKEKMEKDSSLHLYCSCTNDETLEYRVSQDIRIFPCKHNYHHTDDCQKSKRYYSVHKYNKGFRENQDGQIELTLNESINPKDNIAYTFSNSNALRNPCCNTGKVDFVNAIKKLNMLTFKNISFRYHALLPEDSFKNKFYGTIMKAKINNKILGEYNLREDNCKFIYCRLGRVEEKQYIAEIYDKDYSYPYKVPLYLYQAAKKDFGREFDGRNIIFFGFVTIHPKYGKQLYKLGFMEVNDYGLYVENDLEKKLYNHICNFIQQNDLVKRGIRFYKPYEFGFSVYENEYLEDGIIEFDDLPIKLIVEMQYPKQFKKRKKLLGKHLEHRFQFITWNINSRLPDLSCLMDYAFYQKDF